MNKIIYECIPKAGYTINKDHSIKTLLLDGIEITPTKDLCEQYNIPIPTNSVTYIRRCDYFDEQIHEIFSDWLVYIYRHPMQINLQKTAISDLIISGNTFDYYLIENIRGRRITGQEFLEVFPVNKYKVLLTTDTDTMMDRGSYYIIQQINDNNEVEIQLKMIKRMLEDIKKQHGGRLEQ